MDVVGRAAAHGAPLADAVTFWAVFHLAKARARNRAAVRTGDRRMPRVDPRGAR